MWRCKYGDDVNIDISSQVEVEGNGIYDNIGNGMCIAGEATLAHNDIFYNQMAAVCVEAGAVVQVGSLSLFFPKMPELSLLFYCVYLFDNLYSLNVEKYS